MGFALGAAGAKFAFNYANDREWAERTFAEYRAAGYEGGLFRANVIDPIEVRSMCTRIRSGVPRGAPGFPKAPPHQPDRT